MLRKVVFSLPALPNTIWLTDKVSTIKCVDSLITRDLTHICFKGWLRLNLHCWRFGLLWCGSSPLVLPRYEFWFSSVWHVTGKAFDRSVYSILSRTNSRQGDPSPRLDLYIYELINVSIGSSIKYVF